MFHNYWYDHYPIKSVTYSLLLPWKCNRWGQSYAGGLPKFNELFQCKIVQRLRILSEGQQHAIKMQSAAAPSYLDSKVYGAYMGPTLGRQDPGGPNVGPMNFAFWEGEWNSNHPCHIFSIVPCSTYPESFINIRSYDDLQFWQESRTNSTSNPPKK